MGCIRWTETTTSLTPLSTLKTSSCGASREDARTLAEISPIAKVKSSCDSLPDAWIRVKTGEIIMLFKSRRKCQGLRPTPDPNHVSCLPGDCKTCFKKCPNALKDDELAVCEDCVQAYLNHPSASVRLAFLTGGLDGGWIDSNTLAELTRDPNTSVSITASKALSEYVPLHLRDQFS
jgi:hypothetical protein